MAEQSAIARRQKRAARSDRNMATLHSAAATVSLLGTATSLVTGDIALAVVGGALTSWNHRHSRDRTERANSQEARGRAIESRLAQARGGSPTLGMRGIVPRKEAPPGMMKLGGPAPKATSRVNQGDVINASVAAINAKAAAVGTVARRRLARMQDQGVDGGAALKSAATAKSAAIKSQQRRVAAKTNITNTRLAVPATAVAPPTGLAPKIGGAVMRAATPLAIIGGISQGVSDASKVFKAGGTLGASLAAGLQGAAPAAIGLGAGFALAKALPAAAKFAGPVGLIATAGKAVYDGVQGYKKGGASGAARGVADSLTFGMASKVGATVTEAAAKVAAHVNPRALGVIGDHQVDHSLPSTKEQKAAAQERQSTEVAAQRKDRSGPKPPSYKDEWVDKNNVRHVRRNMDVRKRNFA